MVYRNADIGCRTNSWHGREETFILRSPLESVAFVNTLAHFASRWVRGLDNNVQGCAMAFCVKISVATPER